MKYKLLFLVITIQCSLCAYSQNIVLERLSLINKIAKNFKDMQAYGYDYTIRIKAPDGKLDSMKGTMYTDVNQRFMYNVNDHELVYYSKEWYYRVDHDRKEFALLNLNKKEYEGRRTGNDMDVFGGALASEFIDSFIVKHAKLESYAEKGNVISFVLKFPPSLSAIQSIRMDYDRVASQVKKLEMVMVYSMDGVVNSTNKVVQTVVCTNYISGSKPDIATRYFNISNEKAEILQYKDYKPYINQ